MPSWPSRRQTAGPCPGTMSTTTCRLLIYGHVPLVQVIRRLERDVELEVGGNVFFSIPLLRFLWFIPIPAPRFSQFLFSFPSPSHWVSPAHCIPLPVPHLKTVVHIHSSWGQSCHACLQCSTCHAANALTDRRCGWNAHVLCSQPDIALGKVISYCPLYKLLSFQHYCGRQTGKCRVFIIQPFPPSHIHILFPILTELLTGPMGIPDLDSSVC